MTVDDIIKVLTGYETELASILSRFKRSRDGIHIQPNDDVRFRQLVIELIDVLNDTLAEDPYSANITAYYNEGVSYGSASYASVEKIKCVVSAIVTRLKRHPELLGKNQVGSNSKRADGALPYPAKVTMSWLVRHVPIRYWISSVVVLLGTFALGVQASRVNLVREIFQLDQQVAIKASGDQTEQPANREPNSIPMQTPGEQKGTEE